MNLSYISRFIALLFILQVLVVAHPVASQINLCVNDYSCSHFEGYYNVIKGEIRHNTGEIYHIVVGRLMIERLPSGNYGYVFATKLKDGKKLDGGFTPTAMYGTIETKDTPCDFTLTFNHNRLLWSLKMINAHEHYQLIRVNDTAKIPIPLKKTFLWTLEKYYNELDVSPQECFTFFIKSHRKITVRRYNNIDDIF